MNFVRKIQVGIRKFKLNLHFKCFPCGTVGHYCRNGKAFVATNEFELKTRDTNFFYYSLEKKAHDINTCNNMQPSKHKEHNDFIR